MEDKENVLLQELRELKQHIAENSMALSNLVKQLSLSSGNRESLVAEKSASCSGSESIVAEDIQKVGMSNFNEETAKVKDNDELEKVQQLIVELEKAKAHAKISDGRIKLLQFQLSKAKLKEANSSPTLEVTTENKLEAISEKNTELCDKHEQITATSPSIYSKEVKEIKSTLNDSGACTFPTDIDQIQKTVSTPVANTSTGTIDLLIPSSLHRKIFSGHKVVSEKENINVSNSKDGVQNLIKGFPLSNSSQKKTPLTVVPASILQSPNKLNQNNSVATISKLLDCSSFVSDISDMELSCHTLDTTFSMVSGPRTTSMPFSVSRHNASRFI